MKMDRNIFIHFITIFYSTKSCNANAQRRVLVSLFTKLKPTPYGLAWIILGYKLACLLILIAT